MSNLDDTAHPADQWPEIVPVHARRSDRWDYSFQQRYAPIREGRIPTDDEFRPLKLCDLSAQGAAFWLDHYPAFESLVLELGVGSNVSRVEARVIHVERETGQQRCFRVGCEFVSARGT